MRVAGSTFCAGICVLMALFQFSDHAAADVEYSLGPATELLDAAFYAGQPEDGSNVAGRMAFFASASNDGTTVAFFAVNAATLQTAVFLVGIGDPSSWERVTADIPVIPDGPVYWTPDDLFLLVGEYRVPIATGQLVELTVHGYSLDDTSSTRLPTANWFVAHSDEEMVALPVLANGDEDPTREPVIVTDLVPVGIEVDWPAVAPDGSAVTFPDYHGGPEAVADHGDVYVLNNLPAIIGAPKRPGTDISTLAPTTLYDPNVVAIRTEETSNFAHVPHFSEDMSLVFFTEDWNNVFRDDDFFATLAVADFDVMLSNADGSGADIQFTESGNQMICNVTPGGTRLLYLKDVSGIMHLYITTLEVATGVEGDTVGDPANNDIETTTDQEASDASGTVVEVPSGTTIDFPPAQPQEIQITTPIDPATEPELPDGVDSIPVVREFGPEGTTFDQPITVTITYTDAQVEGLDEANLRVYRYNDVSGKYDIEVTTIVDRDLENNTISFTVDGFSKYGLAAVIDTDGDGFTDDIDLDDDNDGIVDGWDTYPQDTDNDGTPNADDWDDDKDGIPDGDDTYPLDTDNDGEMNDVDEDDDGDGILDTVDVFLYDTDNDGEMNDVDDDDDGDGAPDSEEMAQGTDPLDPNDAPAVPLVAWPVAAVVLCAAVYAMRRLSLRRA